MTKNFIQFSLSALAEKVGARVQGDGTVLIRGVAPLDAAVEGDLTFLTNPKYMKSATSTRAAALLLDAPPPTDLGRPLMLHSNPYACLARIISLFHPSAGWEPGVRAGSYVEEGASVRPTATVLPGATVSRGAHVGDRTVLYPGVFLGEGARVGEDCILYPNAVVREKCELGNRVILQPGAVVGADGFGFAPEGGGYLKIPQVGNVVLEDDVEIGANTTIDRAVLGTTRIGRGTKLDNLIQIGHNCQVGTNNVIAALTGFSGSTQTGDHCVFGGQVGLAGHLKIGQGVTLATRTGVMEDIPQPGVYWGSPHLPMKDEMRNVAAQRDLSGMAKRLRRVEKALERLDPLFGKDGKPSGGNP